MTISVDTHATQTFVRLVMIPRQQLIIILFSITFFPGTVNVDSVCIGEQLVKLIF
jgi:hypothetical protein